MALKISQLTEQASPVSGAVLPITQAGSTFKVSIEAAIGVFLPTVIALGDTGKLPYADGASGKYALSSTVKVAGGGAALQFGSNPPGSGALRLSGDQEITYLTDNGNTVSALRQTTNRFVVGSNDAALAGVDVSCGGASGSFRVVVAGATQSTMNGAALTLTPGAAVAANAGVVRLPRNVGGVQFADGAGGSVPGLDVDSVNRVVVGSITGPTAVQIRTSTGSVAVFNGSTESVLVDPNALHVGRIVGSGAVAVELGRDRTLDGNAFIDFHGTTGTDFDLRVIRNSGVNGTATIAQVGTGSLVLQTTGAANIQFTTNNVARWVVDSNGHYRPNADNTYDIGTSAGRVKDFYLAGILLQGATVASTGDFRVHSTWSLKAARNGGGVDVDLLACDSSNRAVVATTTRINVDNSNSNISSGTAHIEINNLNAGGQTLFRFLNQGTLTGGVRADFAGNFNWHANGYHQFYKSTGSALVNIDSPGVRLDTASAGVAAGARLDARLRQDEIGIRVKAHTTQTNDLYVAYKSDDITKWWAVRGDGTHFYADAVAPATPTAGFSVYSLSGVPEFKTSAGNTLRLNATSATTATAGANGDVPAQVSEYLVITFNGNTRKIPLYAN